MTIKPVILEGFHAVKHALRFGAELTDILAVDRQWQTLAKELAPDILPQLAQRVRQVEAKELAQWSPRPHPTGLVAIAHRPRYPASLLQAARSAPLILLEDPHTTGNVGAVIRVAAAAGAAGVATTGPLDPWHPAAIRGSAGLHFALPVMHLGAATLPPKDALTGPLVVLDPTGNDLSQAPLPAQAVLAFGTERDGLSDQLRRRADLVLALPMQPGVSSLNLATTVAATLYYWRLSQK